MLFASHVIVFMCFVAYATSQTYTAVGLTDCGSKNVQINRLTFLPMPVIQPGEGTLSFAASTTEFIKGVIKADLKIVRTVSGIKLPISCYIVEGEKVGSCSYPDLCALMKRLAPMENGCPANLLEHNIDCECPVDITTKNIDIEIDVTIPKAPEAASWLSVGDFDVNIKATVDDGHWPWHKTKYLTRANWTSALKADTSTSKVRQPVWIVFYYLTYCGFCKLAEPGWEAAAQYATGWSRYLRLGAYDCASESSSQNDICEDEGYPQWRIFCPLTNSTQLAFNSERRSSNTKPEDVLMWSIKKLNKIAHVCYGKTWPVRHVIEPQSMDDLNRIIPRNYKSFQLFVSDDILLYSLYVLNNSKTVYKEPIFRLHTTNPVKPGVSLWKGSRNEHGEITLEPMDSTQAMKQFVLNVHNSSHSDKVENEKPGALKPTLTDVDSTVVWMVNKDLRRKLPTLFEDVKSWLNVLHTYYPGSDNIKTFLYDLINFMNDRTTLTSKELQNYINSTSIIKLPDIKFDHCNGSDPTKRGYTCGLWLLFHSMTVKQALLAEDNKLPSNAKPTDVIVPIREFVRKFFLCEECVKHFTNMTSNAEHEISSYKENVLYLWRGHNKVNERLRNEELSSDPAWPKVPFPTKQECNTCVRQVDENNDATEFDENEVYNYLKEYYDIQKTSSKSSTIVHEQYSLMILLFSLLTIVRF
ncbi:unnamed protein product [Adineta ricciae]|uniref:Sulfhydryl oxidase n=1 Tax=Adineta ricciae TaxID=249248 RepID=A0A815WC23_ADIRI|nr:unnamed protein product [Adineta ricciae]CAF1541586.1 unnamed protein product [Adineta ricciae]